MSTKSSKRLRPVIGGSYGATGKYTGLITTDPEIITPEIAGQWLQVNTQNRAINDWKVKEYVRELDKGQWFDSKADIEFDTNGVLQNGQHTLTAIVKSGVTAVCCVKRNMEPKSRIVTDTHRPRTLGDELGSDGPSGKFRHANNVAAAVRVYLPWLAEGKYRDSQVAARINGAYSRQELYRFCLANKEFLETHASHAAGSATKIPFLTATNVMVLSMVFEDASSEIGQAFMAQLAGQTDTCAQPIRKYREGLMRQVDAKHKWNQFYRYAYAVRAFNSFAGRTEVVRFSMRMSDPFPTIEIPEGATA